MNIVIGQQLLFIYRASMIKVNPTGLLILVLLLSCQKPPSFLTRSLTLTEYSNLYEATLKLIYF
jgi:hypothetical protein